MGKPWGILYSKRFHFLFTSLESQVPPFQAWWQKCQWSHASLNKDLPTCHLLRAAFYQVKAGPSAAWGFRLRCNVCYFIVVLLSINSSTCSDRDLCAVVFCVCVLFMQMARATFSATGWLCSQDIPSCSVSNSPRFVFTLFKSPTSNLQKQLQTRFLPQMAFCEEFARLS